MTTGPKGNLQAILRNLPMLPVGVMNYWFCIVGFGLTEMGLDFLMRLLPARGGGLTGDIMKNLYVGLSDTTKFVLGGWKTSATV